MNSFSSRSVLAALALLIAGFASQAAAITHDAKSISPMDCQARGPGTSASELTFGPYGITNPGSTSESVICPIPGDSDSGWSSTPGTSAYLFIYYRTGAVPGSVACSAFTSTAAVTASPSYSVSYSSYDIPASSRSNFALNLADNGSVYTVAPPATLVCTLSPKTALGWIFFQENLATNTP